MLSEWEPTDERDDDLVIIELERVDGRSSELRKVEILDCLSTCMILELVGWRLD
jgi:hypothetical protein